MGFYISLIFLRTNLYKTFWNWMKRTIVVFVKSLSIVSTRVLPWTNWSYQEFTQFLWWSSRLIKPCCLWRLFDFLSSMFLFLSAFPRSPKLCLQPKFSQVRSTRFTNLFLVFLDPKLQFRALSFFLFWNHSNLSSVDWDWNEIKNSFWVVVFQEFCNSNEYQFCNF